jgi:phosphatidylglycerol---prolipoprotein diacylglyceryl transferase
MFPNLFKIGNLVIHTYGVLIALGIFLSARYVLGHAKSTKLSEGQLLDLILYSAMAGIIGARIAYVIANWGHYSVNFLEIFKIWEGGLIYYGGLIAGALVFLIYTRIKGGGKAWLIADVFAPALALSHFFGRLGCFFAGCCYGSVSSLPWAVKFRDAECLAPLNVALHPAQLYEAAGNFVIFLLLDRYNKINHKQGQAFILYLISYGVLRFIVEFFRGDVRQKSIFGLSIAQSVSLSLIIAALILSVLRPKNEI